MFNTLYRKMPIMEIIPMIFFTMCVSLWSGGEDCSYLYTVAPQEQVIIMYDSAGSRDFEGNQLGGFTTHDDKKIYMSDTATPIDFGHEAKHVVCWAEFQKVWENHVNCLSKDAHFMYDTNGDWMDD
jgi:hypothetical protein